MISPRKNPIKRIAKEDIKTSDTKVENLYYFTDRKLKIAYDININNHHDKHANSVKSITSKFYKIGVHMIHIKMIMIEMSNKTAKLMIQYIFKYHLTSLLLFNKHGEDNEKISEIELPITLSINHNLTQSDFDNIIIP